MNKVATESTRKVDDRRFTQVYRMPGEGLIAEFRDGSETVWYDSDGLRYCIMQKRSKGLDTTQEDKALAILLAFESS